MKRRIDFKSESGAALVLEATIVYPIALCAVMFLIIWGFTFVQRGYLQYSASELSSYIAKTIAYPGYQYIDAPFYKAGDSQKTVLEGMNEAMNVHNPYRYIFGFDKEVKDIIDKSAKAMVTDKLPDSGYLKADKGEEVYIPEDMENAKYIYQSPEKNGYVCAISASKGFARVYLAQNYVFSDLFRTLGLGGRRMTIYGDSLVYINDSVELIRITDWAYDTVDMVLSKTGADFSLDKIKTVLNKITNMGDSEGD